MINSGYCYKDCKYLDTCRESSTGYACGFDELSDRIEAIEPGESCLHPERFDEPRGVRTVWVPWVALAESGINSF